MRVDLELQLLDDGLLHQDMLFVIALDHALDALCHVVERDIHLSELGWQMVGRQRSAQFALLTAAKAHLEHVDRPEDHVIDEIQQEQRHADQRRHRDEIPVFQHIDVAKDVFVGDQLYEQQPELRRCVGEQKVGFVFDIDMRILCLS